MYFNNNIVLVYNYNEIYWKFPHSLYAVFLLCCVSIKVIYVEDAGYSLATFALVD